jgi:predicted oxidoreductase
MKRGVPRAQVALAWVLSKPTITAIVGATELHHLDDAFTQVVDGNWGIHAIVKKSLFAGTASA